MTHTRQALVLFLSVAGIAVGLSRRAETAAPKPVAARPQYQIDAKKSRFIVETQTSGLSAMFAHDHKIEVGDFAGVASFSAGDLSAASLELTAKAGSLRLIGENNVGEREAVEGALREDVPRPRSTPRSPSRRRRSRRRGVATARGTCGSSESCPCTA
jgi:hypothetical protein